MAHPNYVFRIFHRPASRARVLINGIPVYDRAPTQNVSPMQPMTHWLVTGDNTFTFELSPAPRSPLTPSMGPHFKFYVAPAEAQESALYGWEYLNDYQKLKLPLDLPLVHAGVWRVDAKLPEPVHLRGSREEFPVEGTPEQHAAVLELYESFATRDAGRFEKAMDLKVSTFESYYGPQPLSRAQAMQRINEPWVMEPYDAPDLRFDSYVDGRVAHVRRTSGKPAVRAIHRDEPYQGWGSDFFMTRLDGRWRIFW